MTEPLTGKPPSFCIRADSPHHVCNCDCERVAKRIAALDAEVSRLRSGLRDILRRADRCHCDSGFPGGCGCGRSIWDMADDALCLSPADYGGACCVCDECKVHRP